MNYFTGCNTAEERKLKWKELAKIHHPDVGGDIKVMQEINRQYLEEVKSKEMFWYSHYPAKSKSWNAASEEVEPAESYWKKNNIDPYAHIAEELNKQAKEMSLDTMDEYEIKFRRTFGRRG